MRLKHLDERAQQGPQRSGGCASERQREDELAIGVEQHWLHQLEQLLARDQQTSEAIATVRWIAEMVVDERRKGAEQLLEAARHCSRLPAEST